MKRKKSLGKSGGEWLIGLLVIIIDQIIKYLLKGVNFPVINGFLSINYATNSGAGFSILSGYNMLLVFLTSAIIALLIYIILKKSLSSVQRLMLIFIASAATSNLIDRVTKGFVVDYIDFSFFPVFNFADFVITVCTIILVISLVRDKKL